MLLDEPFAALDPVTRFDMQRHFVELRRRFRQTAIFVTHDIREALMVGTRIALLKNGSVDAVAPADEFHNFASEEVRAFVATLASA
jgi:ABC-type proline/glycine betaine transport system ATPase subunit